MQPSGFITKSQEERKPVDIGVFPVSIVDSGVEDSFFLSLFNSLDSLDWVG